MAVVDEDIRRVDAAIRALLAAPSLDSAFQKLRDLFADPLDFNPVSGTLRLQASGSPRSCARIAEREGVQVVGIASPDRERVSTGMLRDSLTEIRRLLGMVLAMVRSK